MPRSNRWSKALTKTILKNGRIICPAENLDIVGDVIIEKDKLTNKTILFSPCAASFDTFKNFEDRGFYFNKLIKKYLNGS